MRAILEHHPKRAGLEGDRRDDLRPQEREGCGHVLGLRHQKHARIGVGRPGRELSRRFEYDFPTFVEGQREAAVDSDPGNAPPSEIQDPPVIVFDRPCLGVRHPTMVRARPSRGRRTVIRDSAEATSVEAGEVCSRSTWRIGSSGQIPRQLRWDGTAGVTWNELGYALGNHPDTLRRRYGDCA